MALSSPSSPFVARGSSGNDSPPWNFFSFEAARGQVGLSQQPSGPNPHTPLERSFVPLIRGSLPPDIIDPLQTYFSCGSPATSHPQQVLITEMVKIDPRTCQKVRTASSPLRVCFNNDAVAIMKPRQREAGTPAWRALNSEKIYPKVGCPPGTGAFMEVLASLYMQELVNRSQAADFIIIPRVAYVQWGHPSFNLLCTSPPLMSPLSFPTSPVTTPDVLSQRPPLAPQRLLNLSVRGTGSLHEFIPDCTPSTFNKLESLPSIAQEMIAVLHIILLNADGHEGNLLITKEGKVVMIDMSYILSKEGKDGAVICWNKCKALQQFPSKEILQFIQSIDENRLEVLAQELITELNDNIQKLTLSRQEGESIELEYERILTHRIALSFLKKATHKGWTLSQVGDRLRQHNPRYCGGLVYEVFQEIKRLSREEALIKIDDLCAQKASELPVLSERAFA